MAGRARILHTADWHLGHTLAGVSREGEHAAFLAWLVETLAAREVDALLIAGDVFDSANPPASAQAAWYGFLAHAWKRRPGLRVVVIGGNHDSPTRLDAPDPLLRAFGGRVIGLLPRSASGAPDPDRLLVPLADASGATAAWCVAVPFLRASDLPVPARLEEGQDALVEGVRAVYAGAIAAARERRGPGEAIVAMGHLYMSGTSLSELSERKILGGNLHPLPSDLFPEDVAYAALGHLHRPQRAGGREHLRYSGSPIPLSFPEAAHGHEVVLAEVEGGRLSGLERIEVPPARRLLRLPEGAPAPLEEVLARLRALPPRAPGAPPDALPLLEVRVRMDAPDPDLRRKVEEALEGREARLAKITTERTGHGRALPEAAPAASLRELTPEEVFRRRYARDFAGAEPPRELLEAFHEALESAHASAGGRP